MSVTSGSTIHAFVYDPDGRVLGEYGASAADVIAETIWLNPSVAANDNTPFGGGDGIGGYAPLAVATGSGASAAVTWVHGNHMGVPIAFTDASGTAVPAPSYTLPGFPGQLKSLSDIYYNRHRVTTHRPAATSRPTRSGSRVGRTRTCMLGRTR